MGNAGRCLTRAGSAQGRSLDRKSTRLNSSHSQISYAVFCLKKKKKSKEISLSITRQVNHDHLKQSKGVKEQYTVRLKYQQIAHKYHIPTDKTINGLTQSSDL